tara:strand:- start:336 stop:884 length:549 start_codon:yes stop_codon:yes gene_type:complete
MPKSIPTPCTKQEIDSLIEAAIDNDFFYTLFKLAKKTGRRLGEYYEIMVKDIDWENKTVLTKVLKRRKRIEKEALLDDDMIHLLKRFIQKEGLKLDDYLFHKYSYRHIQNRVTHYAKKAEINHPVSFHNFRHYLITGLIKSGMSYDQVSKITGHSSVGTISVYDHSVASDIREKAMDAMRDL